MQASLAIDEADIVLFVVDGLDNVSDSDKKIRNMLKKAKKEVIVLVNKIDNDKRKENIYAYYELGFEKVMGEKKKDLLPLNKKALEADGLLEKYTKSKTNYRLTTSEIKED